MKSYICPKDQGHDCFVAEISIKGRVLIDSYGTILNLEEVLGCELPITQIDPISCDVCDAPFDSPSETRQ